MGSTDTLTDNSPMFKVCINYKDYENPGTLDFSEYDNRIIKLIK